MPKYYFQLRLVFSQGPWGKEVDKQRCKESQPAVGDSRTNSKPPFLQSGMANEVYP